MALIHDFNYGKHSTHYYLISHVFVKQIASRVIATRVKSEEKLVMEPDQNEMHYELKLHQANTHRVLALI